VVETIVAVLERLSIAGTTHDVVPLAYVAQDADDIADELWASYRAGQKSMLCRLFAQFAEGAGPEALRQAPRLGLPRVRAQAGRYLDGTGKSAAVHPARDRRANDSKPSGVWRACRTYPRRSWTDFKTPSSAA